MAGAGLPTNGAQTAGPWRPSWNAPALSATCEPAVLFNHCTCSLILQLFNTTFLTALGPYIFSLLLHIVCVQILKPCKTWKRKIASHPTKNETKNNLLRFQERVNQMPTLRKHWQTSIFIINKTRWMSFFVFFHFFKTLKNTWFQLSQNMNCLQPKIGFCTKKCWSTKRPKLPCCWLFNLFLNVLLLVRLVRAMQTHGWICSETFGSCLHVFSKQMSNIGFRKTMQQFWELVSNIRMSSKFTVLFERQTLFKVVECLTTKNLAGPALLSWRHGGWRCWMCWILEIVSQRKCSWTISGFQTIIYAFFLWIANQFCFFLGKDFKHSQFYHVTPVSWRKGHLSVSGFQGPWPWILPKFAAWVSPCWEHGYWATGTAPQPPNRLWRCGVVFPLIGRCCIHHAGQWLRRVFFHRKVTEVVACGTGLFRQVITTLVSGGSLALLAPFMPWPPPPGSASRTKSVNLALEQRRKMGWNDLFCEFASKISVIWKRLVQEVLTLALIGMLLSAGQGRWV